ncbi:unnamed protein product, partial [Closterium sp. Naga37s-1]
SNGMARDGRRELGTEKERRVGLSGGRVGGEWGASGGRVGGELGASGGRGAPGEEEAGRGVVAERRHLRAMAAQMRLRRPPPLPRWLGGRRHWSGWARRPREAARWMPPGRWRFAQSVRSITIDATLACAEGEV